MARGSPLWAGRELWRLVSLVALCEGEVMAEDPCGWREGQAGFCETIRPPLVGVAFSTNHIIASKYALPSFIFVLSLLPDVWYVLENRLVGPGRRSSSTISAVAGGDIRNIAS